MFTVRDYKPAPAQEVTIHDLSCNVVDDKEYAGGQSARARRHRKAKRAQGLCVYGGCKNASVASRCQEHRGK